jgi:hypothetical protein
VITRCGSIQRDVEAKRYLHSMVELNMIEEFRVGLRTPTVHECCQCGSGHQWQTTINEPRKRQEPHTTYERLILLVLVHGAMRADPEWLQTLSNTTTVKNISPMRLKN